MFRRTLCSLFFSASFWTFEVLGLLRAIIARGEEKRGAPGPQPPASNMKILVSKGLDKILVSQGLAIILVGKGLANKFW